LAAQKDDYLWLAADFDNFRKRTRHQGTVCADPPQAGSCMEGLEFLESVLGYANLQ
jgi:hypothetical protein